MWTRAMLKESGREALRRNYWKCVLAAFIVMLFLGEFQSNASSGNRDQTNPITNFIENIDEGWDDDLEYYDSDSYVYTDEFGNDFTVDGLPDSTEGSPAGVLQNVTFSIGGFFLPFLKMGSNILTRFLPIAVGTAAAASILLSIFVFSLFEVGGCKFFIENARQPAHVRELLWGFQNGCYGKTVLTLFLRSLFTFLWTLLLIVPGIVKYYEYFMVPYLLADHPEFSREEAFSFSKEIMMGNKFDVFVLDLSFIGWQILSALTFGLLGIFFVNPYLYATRAELYLTLTKDYF